MEPFRTQRIIGTATEQVRHAGRARIQVMNFEAVSDAYAIASNYLHKTGAIADSFATDERLLGIIVTMLQRGEYNKLRLANKAIAEFEARLPA